MTKEPIAITLLPNTSTRELISALKERLDAGFYGHCEKEFRGIAFEIMSEAQDMMEGKDHD